LWPLTLDDSHNIFCSDIGSFLEETGPDWASDTRVEGWELDEADSEAAFSHFLILSASSMYSLALRRSLSLSLMSVHFFMARMHCSAASKRCSTWPGGLLSGCGSRNKDYDEPVGMTNKQDIQYKHLL